jgi:flagellar motor component MotA
MEENTPTARPRLRPDFATLLGLLLATFGIVGGLLLEKGQVRDILAPTALLIVMGGTLGAVLVTTPIEVVKSSMRSVVHVFIERVCHGIATAFVATIYGVGFANILFQPRAESPRTQAKRNRRVGYRDPQRDWRPGRAHRYPIEPLTLPLWCEAGR